MKKRFLITSALPYANGPLHFGHLGGVYIPADIYTRHKKLLGQEAIHICGSDEHGVAIMLSAEKNKESYAEYVQKWHTSHKELFDKYGVEFEYFGRTSADYHEKEVVRWFSSLYEQGYIDRRPEKQLYCSKCPRFLPDRYVEGECYECGFKDARGDECPNCGEWIDALKLKNPRCKICGANEISEKESEHWYLALSKFEKQYKEWLDTKKDWRPHVWQYIKSLIDKGMVDRAITRDLDWGIDVPLPEAKGKKLYVWFDAPIGYVSNTKKYLESIDSNKDYLKDWWHHPETEIIHFIGKDNIIFHALIWPCMILGTNFTNTPDQIPASHFVNLEGKQFSKSANWYVDADEAINTFGQDAMRFYLCTIIPETNDTNFSWDHFLATYNELGNKIGNFINRSMSFIVKNWPEGLSADSFSDAIDDTLIAKLKSVCDPFREALDQFSHLNALEKFLRLGEVANETFHEKEPWKVVKADKAAAESILAEAVVFSLVINSIARPILPAFSKKLFTYFESTLDESVLNELYKGNFDILKTCFEKGFRLSVKPEPLLPRIDKENVEPFRLGEK